MLSYGVSNPFQPDFGLPLKINFKIQSFTNILFQEMNWNSVNLDIKICIIKYLDSITLNRLIKATSLKINKKTYPINKYLFKYMKRRINFLHREIITIFSDNEE